MFSSTIIPQSVQTAEPEGPRDSMEWEPQLGQRGALEAGAGWDWGKADSLGLEGADSSFQKLSSSHRDMMHLSVAGAAAN